MSPDLQEIFDAAKALPLFRAVDTTHLSPAERTTLARAGLSFTTDRNRRVLAMYPQRMREADLRALVLRKRGAR